MLAGFIKKVFGQSREKEQASRRWVFGTMLVFGSIGLMASFALSVERVQQLIDPNAQLICNFNLIFNCGTVMQTWQAKLFGFPNSFIGLMAYPVVISLAVFGLARVKLPKRVMQWAQVAFALGFIFAYWLFFQSVYVIQVLCPWCLLVTTSTTILFATLLNYNLRENNFNLPKNVHKKVLGYLGKDYDRLLWAAWLALMVLLVMMQFRDGLF